MFKSDPDRGEAAARVKRWTKERFSLDAEDTVFVSELEGGAPGFPRLRTVVSFWMAERGHYHFTAFRPLKDVAESDIPPAWFLDALRVEPGAPCGCC